MATQFGTYRAGLFSSHPQAETPSFRAGRKPSRACVKVTFGASVIAKPPRCSLETQYGVASRIAETRKTGNAVHRLLLEPAEETPVAAC